MEPKRLHLCHSSLSNCLKLQCNHLTQESQYLQMYSALQLLDKDCAQATRTNLKTMYSLTLSLVPFVEASSTTTCRRVASMQTTVHGAMIVVATKPEILTPLAPMIPRWRCTPTAPATTRLTRYICPLESSKHSREQTRQQIVG